MSSNANATISHLRASPRNPICYPYTVQETRPDGVRILSEGVDNLAASRRSDMPAGAAFVLHDGWGDRAMSCSHRVWDADGGLLYYYCR